jgi:hypothetical protein
MAKSTVIIEWLVEVLEAPDADGDGDIYETTVCDTYAEAVRMAAQLCEAHSLHHHRIGLVRDRGNDIEGIIDRQWAYVGPDGKLPTHFDWCGGETGGAMVPARYHKELRS